jgi:hypothetical protein
MKKLLGLLAVMGLMTMGLPALADAQSRITIKNSTGADIYELYVSDSGTNDWEEDVLGRDILENGDSLRLRINGSYQKFDLKSVDGNGNSSSWFEFPGRTTDITLKRGGTADYR